MCADVRHPWHLNIVAEKSHTTPLCIDRMESTCITVQVEYLRVSGHTCTRKLTSTWTAAHSFENSKASPSLMNHSWRSLH